MKVSQLVPSHTMGAATPHCGCSCARVITLTLTQELKVAQHLILRLEFRHDSSNQRLFTRNDDVNSANGGLGKGDNTIAVEALLPF